MKHTLVLGIEHLMTGVQLKSDSPITFERESPSMVKAISDSPIQSYWRVNQAFIESTTNEVPEVKHSDGEARWYAQVVASAMRKADERSYAMQTYTRRGNEYFTNGEDSRYAPGEPTSFPVAVVNAMRRKHGEHADEFLAKLRWNGDHWYYNHERMYIGVEPDGYIHT